MKSLAAFLLLLLPLTFPALAADPATGWRGNGTGLWPDARPPLEWSRIPKGALENMRASAAKPTGEGAASAHPLDKGLLRHWLVIGPFKTHDSDKQFDDDALGGEAAAQPTEGDKVGELAWQPVTSPFDDPAVFGTAELPWLDFAKLFGTTSNQFAYAHTYLHSPRGGKARLVVDHSFGLKVFLNGKEVHRNPQRHLMLGYYTALSKLELAHTGSPSTRVDVDLKPGWNRLLLKLSTPNEAGFAEFRCLARLMDPPDVAYESRNIAWMTELPARSTSTPIIVGDRIFLMAEPDELLCIDKHTGRVLWSAYNNIYEAMPADEKAATPAYAQRVDPLIARLRLERDHLKRIELRRQIAATLKEINEPRFTLPTDGHFEAHFGIVGFTMPTPVSDGKHVYVWCGMGVAACYDLDGRRRWITRPVKGEIAYGSSPALTDGVLAVFMNRLYGLDAETGQVKWTQQRVSKNVAAVLAAKLAGRSVFISQRGDVIDPADGALLFRPRGPAAAGAGDEGWCPPVVLGDLLYLPKYGVTNVYVFDFKECAGDSWEPKLVAHVQTSPQVSRKPDGGWIDRWTAGSPLVHDGMLYHCDIWQTFYAFDLATKKMAYYQPMELRGLMHYNAVPVAASATLIGKHLYVMDNQGTTLVLEPGPAYKVVARNRIDTQLDRWLPIPAQETLAYAPPVVDGNRIYLRGERYLYCIGEK